MGTTTSPAKPATVVNVSRQPETGHDAIRLHRGVDHGVEDSGASERIPDLFRASKSRR